MGDVALLLWGIHMVRSGVIRAFGTNLQRVLGRCLGGRPQAFLAGLGLTALLQSSTATGMMATSFVASGVVGLVPALAVMLGANVGTTLIVQLLSFDIGLVWPLLILAGVVAFKSAGRTIGRDIGRIAIGLGLMLLSLHLLALAVAPAEGSLVVQELLAALTSDPLLDLAIAAALAWAAHSSVAVMLLVMSLAGAGLLAAEPALAMVLGANLGSALNPLLAADGVGKARLRLPLGNLLNRLVGAALALPFLPALVELMGRLDSSPARQAADFHTLFNLVLALLFILPLPWLARLLTRLMPDDARPADPASPRYLDPTALDMPGVALAHAAREALRMADGAEAMLRAALEVLETDDRKRLAEISRMDDVLDRLHDALKRYLMRIAQESVTEAESRRLSEILAFSINMEHVGDIIDKNLADLLAKKLRHRLSFSPEGAAEIRDMHGRVIDDLRLAVTVFMAGDLVAARRLIAGKDRFRELERIATERHFERLREGRADTATTTGLHLDLIRDLKRIESHVAATAHPVLEQSGALRDSRLVEDTGPAGS
jgi:phosphate:Na+ symporter